MSNSAEHKKRVAVLQDQLRLLNHAGVRGVRIYHGSTNSTRTQRFDKDRSIDTSTLTHVLEIDPGSNTALVEPGVTMEQLVYETGRRGLVPAVVPEFPNITLGGAIAGGAGESSSYRHGLVHELCESYDVLLGDGALVTASPSSHTDLFRAIPGSCGSLGVITAIRLRLIPATRYVRLRYLPVASFSEAVAVTEKHWDNVGVDFIGGLLFARDRGVIMLGTRCHETGGLPLARFCRAHDEWFSLHADTISRAGVIREEVVPLIDYLFRYDRGAFFVGKYAFDRFRVPFNRLTRFILNPIMNTRTFYQALHETGTAQEYFVQDISVPLERTTALLEHTHEHLGIYPLWLCLLRTDAVHPFSPTNIGAGRVMNVGIWGPLALAYREFVQVNRVMERLTTRLNGRKILYAHLYAPEGEFWHSYPKTLYEQLRAVYRAAAFLDFYEKVVVRERYVSTVKAGFLKAIRPRWRLGLRQQKPLRRSR
ncbi:MAG: hypothetical protein COV10_03285 [Candidatus Vogelbacteria bacterium CG10_big_fil_rev_8_21_14_0_10_51_16]|uniref:Delta(24)-sterol reductase n=1 Tax=Candidatus Vogelbacteria bacterium CG10_big_fil_rev_8_21_14_0_10_51_16 TaxID=1975045 RepID=A0A2H0RE22_9BACT|nr:MAG: hypothetical protein COV10_03285 [Candidatus Vogelbacteria bacterium CG10_big_fil_rev_8_21_14_0_10_51_16]